MVANPAALQQPSGLDGDVPKPGGPIPLPVETFDVTARDLLAILVGQLRHGQDGRKGPASPYSSVGGGS